MTKGPEYPRKALGRGLASLLPTRPAAAPPPEPAPRPAESVAQVSIDLIDPNPVQPREVFQADRLHELAQSIIANGIIQPLVLRRRNERYQLIAGERRWRAAKMAGLDTVPAVIREIDDDRLLEVSLIENIQREDLNAIESAHAFDRLSREFKLTHEEIARRTGKDRATITNILRLLRLPEDVQQLLAERKIAMGHARALLGLPTEETQRDLAQRAASHGLSVRQVEQLVQRLLEPPPPKSQEPPPQDPNVKVAIEDLERALGTRVRIVQKNEQRGRIEVDYYSQDDLHRIYLSIVGETQVN
jgi:ParB family transcriptional regulator, chromosome partitioning protein